MNIYIHKDGQQYGPFTLDQLREYVSQGSFSQEDLACYDGQNWVAIAQIPGFAQTQPVAAQDRHRLKRPQGKPKLGHKQEMFNRLTKGVRKNLLSGEVSEHWF